MKTLFQTVIVAFVALAILVTGVLSAENSINQTVTMQTEGATPVVPTEEPTETATVVPTEEPTNEYIERLVEAIIAIIREILASLGTPVPAD